MSNRNRDEIPRHRKPEVSLAMVISQGLGGPKLTAEGYLAMDRWLIFHPFDIFSMKCEV